MVAVSIREKSLSEDELVAMQDYKTSPLFNELEKAVLQYATEMTATPVRIDDTNFAVLKKQYSEKQLVELTSAIAWENWRARFNHAFGIESAEFAAAPSEQLS